MTGAALDPELLAAFVPEFVALAVRLGAAPEAGAARAALDGMRAMAEALDLASLRSMLETAEPLLDPHDGGALATLAAALAGHAEAIAAAGQDLPLQETPPSAAETPAPESAPAATASSIRTLIVDDSAIMRRLLRDTLAADPTFLVVGEAADGEQALAAMRRLRPDLMLLDIEMPVLDGMGALRRWALEGKGAVVIVSSAARPAQPMAIEARRLGAAAIVGKPSGALSLDMAERGSALLRAARRATGLPAQRTEPAP
jgi:CheY-like chemotaxis protein